MSSVPHEYIRNEDSGLDARGGEKLGLQSRFYALGRQSVTIPIAYEDIGTHLAGCKVEVLWEDDEVWYRGEIVKCCEDREFGDEYAQREKAAVDDDDGPDKDNEDAFSNKVEIQYETGELESMDIEDFKDIISKGSIRARGSILARRGKKKASKKANQRRKNIKTTWKSEPFADASRHATRRAGYVLRHRASRTSERRPREDGI